MVVERVQIPPGSMVLGVPAKVRGEVAERHTELIRSTAAHYVAKGERFKGQGSLE